MAVSNITYTGKVTVKVKGKPPVRLKNKGTISFFKSLYNILSLTIINNDTETLRSILPNSMSIVLADSQTPRWDSVEYTKISGASILSSPMPIVSRKVQDSSVSFDSLLTHSYINSAKYDSTKIAFIVLLDGQADSKVLAYTTFNLSDIATVAQTPNSQATISWQLSFGNTDMEGN